MTGSTVQDQASTSALMQRVLLLELLDRPEGGTVRTLARRLKEPVAVVRAAAAELETKSLVDLDGDHVVASGPALDFDELFDGVAL